MADYNPYMAGAGGLAGAGIGAMFGNWQNPADKAMDYYNQIPGLLQQYMSPYINRGNQAGNALQGQYGNLLNDPGGRVNQIGQSYHQSPGFQFALQQALQGANHAAAAGGMAGSPQNQQQDMALATNLANQDYNQWLQNAMGLYGMGMQGEQGMYNTGAAAGIGLGQDIGSVLAQQGNLAYQGQNADNMHSQGELGAFGSGIGSLLAAFL